MIRWLIHPVVVAIIVTGLNALKPVLVDDPYYLTVAAHLTVNITQPYPNDVHWGDGRKRGMDVLCPPALPYWLAVGQILLGNSEHLLKLWLFPIVLLLTLSLRSLQRSWQLDDRLLPLVAYGGGCLPMINFMLDVPAVACGIAALALIVRGGLPRAALAGLMMAVAFQTKYTMLTMPVVAALYCLLTRKWLELIVSLAVGGALVNGWEWYVWWKQGSSHFWHHIKDQSGKVGILTKLNMVLSHARHAGFLLIGPVIVILQSRWPQKPYAWITAVVGIVTFLGVTFLPAPWGMRFARIGFHALAVIFSVAAGMSMRILWRRGDAVDRLLVIWIAIELVAMVAMSPFVAGRRVVPFGFAFAIAATRFALAPGRPSHALSTSEPRPGVSAKTSPGQPPVSAPPVKVVDIDDRGLRTSRAWLAGPILGVALFALDAWDARAEMVIAQAFQNSIYNDPNTKVVSYLGTWGFEYYLTKPMSLRMRLGLEHRRFLHDMIQPVPLGIQEPKRDHFGRVSLSWLDGTIEKFGFFYIDHLYVIPMLYDSNSFSRAGHRVPFELLDLSNFKLLAHIETGDWIQGSTIPTLYGGGYPIVTKPTPRFGVVVLRCTSGHFLKEKP